MREKIFGRKKELESLTEKLNSKKSELVVLYGRRRVGKSALIKHFINTTKANALIFEGLENQRTPIQIKHFSKRLKAQIQHPLLKNVEFSKWEDIFDYLTEYISNNSKKN